MRYTVLRLLKKLETRYGLTEDDDFVLLRKLLEPYRGVNKSVMIQKVGVIINEVLDYYAIEKEVFLGECRNAEYVRPRQVAAYLCIKLVGKHSGIIASQVNRTHSNVNYGFRVIRDEITYNKALEKEVKTLTKTICNQKLFST